MSILQSLVRWTEGIEGLNGVAEAMKKLIDADGAAETSAAAGQLAAELAITTVVTATVRTSMSALRLGLAISGQSWKWEALSWAAGAASGLTAGALIDWVNAQNIGGQIYDWTHSAGISDRAGEAGSAATVPARRDPLVLDLDGDGIETTSSREGTVVLFDHDADGVKTGTGWVKPDDGWLVMDRNGNSTIDSGRELFGVDTMKSNGSLAVDGFDALKDLDANKDGQINASDAMFSNLKIWRDLNQDGISQSNELSTLASNSITAIGVKASAVSNDLGNGNIQTAAGTFTRSNGSTGSTGETNSEAGNLDLLVDTFHREFTDHITLTAQAKALPDLKGSGQVRDLSEAISLSSTLGNTVQTYAQQTTRDAQISRLDGLIEQWANTSNMKSLKAQADALTSNGVSLTYDLQGLTAGSAEYTSFIKTNTQLTRRIYPPF